jgi:hypothetical protein
MYTIWSTVQDRGFLTCDIDWTYVWRYCANELETLVVNYPNFTKDQVHLKFRCGYIVLFAWGVNCVFVCMCVRLRYGGREPGPLGGCRTLWCGCEDASDLWRSDWVATMQSVHRDYRVCLWPLLRDYALDIESRAEVCLQDQHALRACVLPTLAALYWYLYGRKHHSLCVALSYKHAHSLVPPYKRHKDRHGALWDGDDATILYCPEVEFDINLRKASYVKRRMASSGMLQRVAVVKPTFRRNLPPPSSGWQELVNEGKR